MTGPVLGGLVHCSNVEILSLLVVETSYTLTETPRTSESSLKTVVFMNLGCWISEERKKWKGYDLDGDETTGLLKKKV